MLNKKIVVISSLLFLLPAYGEASNKSEEQYRQMGLKKQEQRRQESSNTFQVPWRDVKIFVLGGASIVAYIGLKLLYVRRADIFNEFAHLANKWWFRGEQADSPIEENEDA